MFFDIAIAIILVIALYSFISSEIYARRSRRCLVWMEGEIKRMMGEEEDRDYLEKENDDEDES